jgi:hypothetical protein
MANHRSFFDVKMVQKLGEIVGILIHIVALPWLAGAAVAAAIMRDDAMLSEEQHLRVPGISLRGHPCEKVTTGPDPQSL